MALGHATGRARHHLDGLGSSTTEQNSSGCCCWFELYSEPFGKDSATGGCHVGAKGVEAVSSGAGALTRALHVLRQPPKSISVAHQRCSQWPATFLCVARARIDARPLDTKAPARGAN